MAEYPLTGKAEPSGFRKFIRADKIQRALLIICAGVIITIIPILVLFLFFQKEVYSGMAAGAVKG